MLVSSAAAGVRQRLLWISWFRLALFARGFGSVDESFVFDTMCAKLDRFLENERDGFGDEHITFQLSFLIMSNFGGAANISILSNNQTGHLLIVGSASYSKSCSDETTDLNLGYAAINSNSVKNSFQKTFEMRRIR